MVSTMGPLLGDVLEILASPWTWANLFLAASMAVSFWHGRRHVPRAAWAIWVTLAVVFLTFNLARPRLEHPLALALQAMFTMGPWLRFARRYSRNSLLWFVFLASNALLATLATLILLGPGVFALVGLPVPSLVLTCLAWAMVNLALGYLALPTLDPLRSRTAKVGGLTLLLPWTLTLTWQVILAYDHNVQSLPFTAVLRGELPSRVLDLLALGALTVFWSEQVREGLGRLADIKDEDHWRIQTLGALLESYGYQMQPGISFRQGFLTQVCERIREAMGAAGAAVFLVDEYKDVLRAEVIAGSFPALVQINETDLTPSQRLARFINSEIPLHHSLLGPAIRDQKVIFYESVALTDEFFQTEQAQDWEDLSLMVAPLHFVGKLLGILAITLPRTGERVHPRTMRRLKDLARWLSQILYTFLRFDYEKEKLRIDIEARQIREIQDLLLPKRLLQLKSVQLAALSRPALGVSGDLYDVVPLRKGEILLVIGDVAGKGLPASITMVMIRTILYLLAHQRGMSPSRLMDIINWGVAGKINLDRYATLGLAHYDLRTRTFTFSNAAHHPPLIYRAAQRTWDTLDSEGIPIGLEKNSRYGQSSTTLEKNDIIVLYTDGIIETVNEKGEFFGLERFKRVLLANVSQKADKVIKALEAELEAFRGKAARHDDQTVLVMKVET